MQSFAHMLIAAVAFFGLHTAAVDIESMMEVHTEWGAEKARKGYNVRRGTGDCANPHTNSGKCSFNKDGSRFLDSWECSNYGPYSWGTCPGEDYGCCVSHFTCSDSDLRKYKSSYDWYYIDDMRCCPMGWEVWEGEWDYYCWGPGPHY